MVGNYSLLVSAIGAMFAVAWLCKMQVEKTRVLQAATRSENVLQVLWMLTS